jgi:transposase InsO family protein
MCRVLGVSAAGYYDWFKRGPSATALRREQIAQAAEEAFYENGGRAGYRKVHVDVAQDKKIACAKETVRRALQKKGLFFKPRRKFIRTTESDPKLPVAPNILNRDFTAIAPNLKWAADITYLPTQAGWIYLAVVLDLFSRRIVGWALARSLESALVLEAFRQAFQSRTPEGQLLHHSDRGSQYASQEFQKELATLGVTRSMSRKGNCWDNAPTERFFGSLKTEGVGDQIYDNLEHARVELFEYIELYYNRKRRHQALGYLSPEAFEMAFRLEHEPKKGILKPLKSSRQTA